MRFWSCDLHATTSGSQTVCTRLNTQRQTVTNLTVSDFYGLANKQKGAHTLSDLLLLFSDHLAGSKYSYKKIFF